MLSIKEWRLKEETGPAVETPEQQAEPDDNDWEFYKTKVQGKANQYLNMFLDAVSKQQLNLARKGFIIQEVMSALNLNTADLIKAVSNVKRALAKKAQQQNQPQAQPQVQPSQVQPQQYQQPQQNQQQPQQVPSQQGYQQTY